MRNLALLLIVIAFVFCKAEFHTASKPSNTCPPGWTGTACDSPICDTPQKIENHKGGSEGDLLFWDRSTGCSGEFQFYVDEFVQNVTVYVEGGHNFFGQLYKDNRLVESRGTPPSMSSDVHVTQFDEIAIFYGYGAYRMILQSDGTQDCTLYVRSPTTLMIDGGFVQNRRDDTVQYVVPQQNQGVGRYPLINNASYFAFQYPRALSHPGKPIYVYAYQIGSYGTKNLVKDRYNCGATLIAGPFECDSNPHIIYHLKISGVDTKGNNWERVYQYICESSTTPSPPSTVTPPSFCLNGGIMVNQGTPEQECYCGYNYEGPMCEIRRCFNNGEVGRYGACTCSEGYSGEFCQHVQCEYKTEGVENLDYRAIVFIIRVGRSMVGHIDKARRAAELIIRYYRNTAPTYIQQWVLITVFNGEVNIYNTNSGDEFVMAIASIPNTEDTICDDAIYTAISAAIDHPMVQMYKRSLLFIFTDGLPNDNMEERLRLLHQLSFFRGQMFFMVADSVTGRCNIDTASEEYRGMGSLAQFSFGQLSYVDINELDLITYLLATTAHKGDHIFSNDLRDSCKRAPKYQTFFIDKSLEQVFITATGKNLTLYLTDPERNRAELIPYHQASNRVYIWQIEKLLYGGYLMELQSDSYDPCSIRVFGYGNTPLWVGVSHSVNEDAAIAQPVYKETSHVVALINNVNYLDPTHMMAEATIWTNEGNQDRRTVLYGSNGIYRDGCSFNLYFGAWQCIYPNEFFYINVYVAGPTGDVIQRSFTGFCSIITTTDTPPGDCMNGGVQVTLPDNNVTCICPAHYTGDKCQTIQCLNLGTPLGNVCECIAGFTGQFCEKTSCHVRNRDVSFGANGRSLTLIIQDSISTRSTIRNIKKQMPTLIQDLTHQHKDWISNYQIWRFNDSSFTSIVSSPDPNAFMEGINSLSKMNTLASDPSCRDLYVLKGLIRVLLNHELTLNGIIYFFINGYMKINETSEVDAVYKMLERTKVMFNAVLMAGSPCGHSMDEKETTLLMNFAAFTGGQFIMVMPPRAGNVIRSIPTLYRTNYIYENFVSNCTTTQSFYFPIDSQTQSFTAYIVGEIDDGAVTYYRPDGTTKVPYNIWKDNRMGSRMDQIIKECDDGWELHGNRCWRFVIESASWLEARDTCHNDNAVLISIFNQDEQNYVDTLSYGVPYWTGLNDLVNLNQFVWDTPDGKNLTLDSTGYKNFAPGEPSTDLNKRCVYDQRPDGWFADDCSKKLFFICVKHAYDADYEPDYYNLGDLLARGIWKLTVQSASGGCSVQIYGQSGIQLFTQYTADIHMDSGTEQPYSQADDNRIIAHVTNQVSTSQGMSGILEYAHLYKTSSNMSIVQAQTYAARDSSNCAFEYLSSSFKCPADNFLALNTGIDRFGYLYQRIEPIACFKGPQQEDCLNGIWRNGHCVCDPYYEGDFCETPICQNGILDNLKENCRCFYGYTGRVCNIPICNHGGSKDIPEVTNRTFILLVDGSQSGRMQTVSTELESVLKSVFNKTTNYTNWFTHYTGVVFRDSSMQTQSLSDTIESDDPNSFITQIMAEATKTYTPSEEARSTIAAIVRAMDSPYIQPRSYIWIVTGGNAEDYNRETLALNAVARKHCYVNFLIIGDDQAPGNVPYNDSSLNAYYNLVIQSSGQLYQVPNEAGQLATFWVSLFATYYDAYFITTYQKLDCSQGLEEYIQLGSDASNLIIDAIGVGQAIINHPDGNIVTPTTVAKSKTNRVFTTAANIPGLWRVQLPSSKGFCRLEIRGQSSLEVFIGYVHEGGDSGQHSNDVDYRPVTDGENVIVAKTSTGKVTFAQIFAADERKLLWSSPMIERQRCTYPYISSKPFECTQPSIAVSIDGEDNLGFAFRRMIHTHCVGNFRPIPSPITNISTVSPLTTTMIPTLTSPTCMSDAKFDVMLMFDVSAGIEANDFHDMVNEFSTVPEKMTIGENNIRFAIGYYADEAYFLADFNSITNAADYLNALRFLNQMGYQGDMGNNISDIFTKIDKSLFRPQVIPVLVFFSSMGWDEPPIPYPDPTAQANDFRNGGGRILPIGYGAHPNDGQLKAIGGGCDKMAGSLSELRILLSWVTSAICSNEPYCT